MRPRPRLSAGPRNASALHDPTEGLFGFAKVNRDVTERSRLIEEREQLATGRIEFLA